MINYASLGFPRGHAKYCEFISIETIFIF